MAKPINKTKAVNKKKNIRREETVIIWFTFKSGLELTGFQSVRLSFQQLT